MHTLALKSDGTLVAWGLNDNGQCTVPAGLSNVVGIAAGQSLSLALKSDGSVVAWGQNTQRQLAVPTGSSHLVALAASGYTGVALRDGAFDGAPTVTITSPGQDTPLARQPGDGVG